MEDVETSGNDSYAGAELLGQVKRYGIHFEARLWFIWMGCLLLYIQNIADEIRVLHV